MTIITKSLSEKKCEKSEEPLVSDVKVGVLVGRRSVEPESQENVQERRNNSATTACLFITALLVMSCGIIAGVCIYRQYARSQVQRFYGWCTIPYEAPGIASGLRTENKIDNPFAEEFPADERTGGDKGDKFFREDFEIDEGYEKISVPDFSGGKRSKFIHDFKSNNTGIVDMDGQRCFIMPLNRTNVLPPKNLLDLVMKMRDGYYEVDTGVLKHSMHVLLPAIENRGSLGIYIQRECFGYPIYRLEHYISGVYKRSAVAEVKFIEFAGKSTEELNIVNYNELAAHESQLPVAMA